MAKNFYVDDRQLKKWGKMTKIERPSQARAIMREVLNAQAFATRKMAQKKVMPDLFNIRNRWAINSVLVDKAKKNNDPKKVYAYVGSKKRWRYNKARDFLGLKYQEFGRTYRDHPLIHTEWSRGGSFAKNVKPSYRSKKLLNHTVASGSWGNVVKTIRILERKNYKGFIRLKKNYRKLRKGYYAFGSIKVKYRDKKKHKRLYQVVDQKNKTIRTLPRPWLKTSVKKAVTKSKTIRYFKQAWERFTTKRK